RVGAIEGQVTTLFDLTRSHDRRIDRANEGVAMALAMQTASLQPDSNFGMAGGVGYYEDRSAATLSFIGRGGSKSFVTAGVGVGFNSGSVGARGGFQIEW
ncbi:MAG: YadA C-terminal domain-containing protein, partial [Novosphingobium sp.]|nr:YadA C-terminal domain-containing protein [Novosphingobium sp.]